ncbi:MAG: phenylalanine--tRNA ligase subunit beta [Chloroflexota bacterium]|nr:phenylalanine--tRNA ligase subunit beta [Chloroflexota bacterium]
MTTMRVPLSWLNDFVDVSDLDPVELAERLTLAGLEVEHIRWVGLSPSPGYHKPPDRMGEQDGLPWDRESIFVGEILETKQHPNADRLLLATVGYGGEKPMTIITGAPNLQPGDSGLKVAFATIGARLIDPYAEIYQTFRLKAGKIRGIRSEGMACSERELGISEQHEGIIILPPNAPVGTPLADYMGDAVLTMDLTPNLARNLNIIGVAREVAALYNLPMKREQPELASIAGIVRPEDISRPAPPAKAFCHIDIVDSDLCFRYTATLIKDVETGESPGWMKDRLRKAGVRPIYNIVDATNYAMLEWGQPTHAFDYDLLVERALRASEGEESVPTIIMRRAEEGERFTTLDGVDREMTEDMLMITDPLGAIAIGGVMGGLETEVNENTRNVLLESASFEFINNRRTSQTLRLPSEATARFSKGVSSEMTVPAAQRCARLMVQLAGGEIVQGMEDCYPAPQQSVQVALTAAEVERILGMDVATDQIQDILTLLEFDVDRSGDAGEMMQVTVPWHRLDVSIDADLIEEVARIIGYDKIPTTLMDDTLPPQWRNWQLEGKERVRDVLVGMGLQDTISYALIGPEVNPKLLAAQPGAEYDRLDPDLPPAEMLLPVILDPEALVRLENPLAATADRLRSTLVGSMLVTMGDNLRHSERVALFEIGKVYWPLDGEALPAEPEHIAVGLSGPRDMGAWLNVNAEPLDFFDLKGVVEELLNRFGLLDDARFEAVIHPVFGPRAARLVIDGRHAGILGEVHPLVRRAFGLFDQRASVAELQLEPFIAVASEKTSMQPVSSYPVVKEDLAVVVDEEVTAEQVEGVIRQGGGSLLVDVQLFDLYQGKQIESGKKSLAFSLTFQAMDRTLKDKDVEKVRRRIIGRLEKVLGAVLRA